MLNHSAKSEKQLVVTAFASTVSYLKLCLIHEEILTLKKFTWYQPVDEEVQKEIKSVIMPQHLVSNGSILFKLFTESINIVQIGLTRNQLSPKK